MSERERRSRRQRAEARLVAEIAAGSSDALRVLYEQYAGLLLGLATKVLRNAGEAEEVLQEVILQVWQQASRYDSSRSSVSTWLVLITRSRAIDRLRSRKVLQKTVVAARHESPDRHASPEGISNVLMLERRRRLTEELSSLPDEQREVLELAFFEGLTQVEIARRTGTPLGTVKTRTLLAMKKLRKALADELEELL